MTSSMRKRVLAVIGLLAAGLVASTAARADCGAQPRLEKQSWRGGGTFQRVSFDRGGDDEPVVGFWNIVLTAKGNTGPNSPPDGAPIDKGLQHWHADGTEFLNSSGINPATQNYCMGVWERVGARTYVLNHFAYPFDLAGKGVGLDNIREEVTVSHDGSTMRGTFTIESFDLQRNRLRGVKGVVRGTRVDVRTKPYEIL